MFAAGTTDTRFVLFLLIFHAPDRFAFAFGVDVFYS